MDDGEGTYLVDGMQRSAVKAVEDISNLPASNTKSGVLGEQSVTPTATPQANFVDDISNRPTPRRCEGRGRHFQSPGKQYQEWSIG
jgi:hypothetical protein